MTKRNPCVTIEKTKGGRNRLECEACGPLGLVVLEVKAIKKAEAHLDEHLAQWTYPRKIRVVPERLGEGGLKGARVG